MSLLEYITPDIMSVVIVINKVGNGMPLYLFEGIDIQEAASKGFITITDNKIWLSSLGIAALEQFSKIDK